MSSQQAFADQSHTGQNISEFERTCYYCIHYLVYYRDNLLETCCEHSDARQELRFDNAQLRVRIHALSKTIESLANNMAMLSQYRRVDQQLLLDAQQKGTQLCRALYQQVNTNTAILADTQAKDDRIKVLVHAIEVHQDEISTLECRIRTHEETLAEQQRTIASHKALIKDQQEYMELQRYHHEDDEKKLRALVDEGNSERLRLQNDLLAAYYRHQSDIAHSDYKIAEYNKEISYLRGDLLRCYSDLARARERATGLEQYLYDRAVMYEKSQRYSLEYLAYYREEMKRYYYILMLSKEKEVEDLRRKLSAERDEYRSKMSHLENQLSQLQSLLDKNREELDSYYEKRAKELSEYHSLQMQVQTVLLQEQQYQALVLLYSRILEINSTVELIKDRNYQKEKEEEEEKAMKKQEVIVEEETGANTQVDQGEREEQAATGVASTPIVQQPTLVDAETSTLEEEPASTLYDASISSVAATQDECIQTIADEEVVEPSSPERGSPPPSPSSISPPFSRTPEYIKPILLSENKARRKEVRFVTG